MGKSEVPSHHLCDLTCFGNLNLSAVLGEVDLHSNWDCGMGGKALTFLISHTDQFQRVVADVKVASLQGSIWFLLSVQKPDWEVASNQGRLFNHLIEVVITFSSVLLSTPEYLRGYSLNILDARNVKVAVRFTLIKLSPPVGLNTNVLNTSFAQYEASCRMFSANYVHIMKLQRGENHFSSHHFRCKWSCGSGVGKVRLKPQYILGINNLRELTLSTRMLQ